MAKSKNHTNANQCEYFSDYVCVLYNYYMVAQTYNDSTLYAFLSDYDSIVDSHMF